MCFSGDTGPVDSRSFPSSPSPGLPMVGTMILSSRINLSSVARLCFQLSAHKLDLRNKNGTVLAVLKLSLSQFRFCFFMWFRVRGVALIGVNKFFFFFIFVFALARRLFIPFLTLRSLHARALLVSRFSHRFCASLRRFFFLLFYIYMKKYIS